VFLRLQSTAESEIWGENKDEIVELFSA